jgi:hypothetical protein
MKTRLLSRRSRARRFSIGILPLCAVLTPAFAAGPDAPVPVKLAVFDFELEDFSPAASYAGASEAEAAQLRLVSIEARRLIERSGRYSLVDTSGADAAPVKAHRLRNCNGCDADIALKLGAEQSFVGSVARISRTEYTVQFQIRDARTGRVILSGSTDLRMGADYSWSRGAAWLIKNRLLNDQGRQ